MGKVSLRFFLTVSRSKQPQSDRGIFSFPLGPLSANDRPDPLPVPIRVETKVGDSKSNVCDFVLGKARYSIDRLTQVLSRGARARTRTRSRARASRALSQSALSKCRAIFRVPIEVFLLRRPVRNDGSAPC